MIVYEYDPEYGYHVIGNDGVVCGGPACLYSSCDFRERYRGKDTPAPIVGKHSHRGEGGEMIECEMDHYVECMADARAKFSGAVPYEPYRPVPDGLRLHLAKAMLVRLAAGARRPLYPQALRDREGTETW